MKNIIILICFFGVQLVSTAQSSITIEAAQLITKFKFKDSDKTKLNKEYTGIFTNSYGVGYRYDLNNGLLFRLGLSMRNGGANLNYDDSEYSWRLKYFEPKLGIGYLYKINKISPYLMVFGYFGYLVQGSQILNNEHFNIIESVQLKRSDFGLNFSPGVDIVLHDRISTNIEFNYLLGLSNLEKDTDQKSSNTALGLTLGLSFSISK